MAKERGVDLRGSVRSNGYMLPVRNLPTFDSLSLWPECLGFPLGLKLMGGVREEKTVPSGRLIYTGNVYLRRTPKRHV